MTNEEALDQILQQAAGRMRRRLEYLTVPIECPNCDPDSEGTREIVVGTIEVKIALNS